MFWEISAIIVLFLVNCKNIYTCWREFCLFFWLICIFWNKNSYILLENIQGILAVIVKRPKNLQQILQFFQYHVEISIFQKEGQKIMVISFGRPPGEWKSKQQMNSLLSTLCENEKKWRKNIHRNKFYLFTWIYCISKVKFSIKPRS